MFKRNILSELKAWARKKERKPLVLRGARQVGKTTLVRQFSGDFDRFIYLNLELPEDSQPFEQFIDIDTLIQTIFFIKNIEYSTKEKTLLFIDEIQEIPQALSILRYFYEQASHIHVIAAGSLLEILFDPGISFPVGRVEYLIMRPVSFPEFLEATNETTALHQLRNVPVTNFAIRKLLKLFHTYTLIGGMPEIVAHYAEHRDLAALSTVYESLLVSYLHDVEKYAKSSSQVLYVRHAIRASLGEAGKRIRYAGFGQSNYGSREMSEALKILEKALLIKIIHPNTGFSLPLLPDLKKSPKLQFLDTGMINYFTGVQKEILGTKDLNDIYQGRIIEHMVGQELLAKEFGVLYSLNFWVREKKTSNAEVDFIYPFEGKLIPIEVKAGKTGNLRSLHVFMEDAPHQLAIRFYAGNPNITDIDLSSGKKYYLLSLPYCLVSQIDTYLRWFIGEIRDR